MYDFVKPQQVEPSKLEFFNKVKAASNNCQSQYRQMKAQSSLAGVNTSEEQFHLETPSGFSSERTEINLQTQML